MQHVYETFSTAKQKGSVVCIYICTLLSVFGQKIQNWMHKILLPKTKYVYIYIYPRKCKHYVPHHQVTHVVKHKCDTILIAYRIYFGSCIVGFSSIQLVPTDLFVGCFIFGQHVSVVATTRFWFGFCQRAKYSREQKPNNNIVLSLCLSNTKLRFAHVKVCALTSHSFYFWVESTIVVFLPKSPHHQTGHDLTWMGAYCVRGLCGYIIGLSLIASVNVHLAEE